MTTFARGVSAPMRGVGAFIHIERPVISRKAIVEAGREARSVITANEAERQAIRREQAWIDAAAMAGIRPIPRG